MNRAAELGPSRFSWWQDWRGKTAAIIASGPTAKNAPIHLLRDRGVKFIAIKNNIELCPWADVVYDCDGVWFRNVGGLPDYKGLKLSYSDQACSQFSDIRKISIKMIDKILVDEPGLVGSGKNSGFQSLNIEVQFGATRIILVGYDMHGRDGVHWYGRNVGPGMNNPDDNNFSQWVRALDAAAPDLHRLGVEVANVSPTSMLRGFPHTTIERTIVDWNL